MLYEDLLRAGALVGKGIELPCNGASGASWKAREEGWEDISDSWEVDEDRMSVGVGVGVVGSWVRWSRGRMLRSGV